MGYYIHIYYTDGTLESHYIDDYAIKNNCLMTYVRCGVNRGYRYIPLDKIKEWKIEK